MNYAILASGSKGNACIIETNGTRILIDCGTTKRYLSQSFESLGLGFDDIDHVLITHDHSDHTSQLKHFKNKSVFTSSPIWKTLQQSFHMSPLRLKGFISCRLKHRTMMHIL
ncbi:MBL fold metallo-hydrolase [Erysipelothrix sp. D19-032]